LLSLRCAEHTTYIIIRQMAASWRAHAHKLPHTHALYAQRDMRVLARRSAGFACTAPALLHAACYHICLRVRHLCRRYAARLPPLPRYTLPLLHTVCHLRGYLPAATHTPTLPCLPVRPALLPPPRCRHIRRACLPAPLLPAAAYSLLLYRFCCLPLYPLTLRVPRRRRLQQCCVGRTVPTAGHTHTTRIPTRRLPPH